MVRLDPLQLPRDAKLVSLLLESLGVKEYDPSIVHQLLELSHRHILEVLQDATTYAEHADRKDISLEDVKIAVEGKMQYSFTNPPSKDMLMELATKKNSMPLPQVPEKFGLRLPTEKHTLLAPNLSIVPKKVQQVNPVSIQQNTQVPTMEADVSSVPFIFQDIGPFNPRNEEDDYDMQL